MFNKSLLRGCLVAVLSTFLMAPGSFADRNKNTLTRKRNLPVIKTEDANICSLLVESLREKAKSTKSDAWSEARAKGLPTKGGNFELIAFEKGRPLYYTTNNADAALMSGAHTLQEPPLELTGEGILIGVWDGGAVLTTHQEFQSGGTSRVTIMDDSFPIDHATHVAGTIGAAGLVPEAKGMAPAVNIDSYNWSSDSAEMLERAATAPGQSNKIQLSNHSYGYVAGWFLYDFSDPNNPIPGDFDNSSKVDYNDLRILANYWLSNEPVVDIAPFPLGDGIADLLDYALFANNWQKTREDFGGTELYWWGLWGENEDRNFGRYAYEAPDWDWICYSTQYYLPFKAAGNDRADYAPSVEGTPFKRLDFDTGLFVQEIYDSSDPNRPYDDGWDHVHYGLKAGYDTITPIGTAKNIMTVGAIDDIGDMTVFSGWGPTDDGRIKPDIVANGTTLFSPVANIAAGGNYWYSYYSGTSQACPAASGSAALLVQYYNECFPSEAMWASTLKALIIHTAGDLGNPGPDYRYGWGAINVADAADYITADFTDPTGQRIIEDVLAPGSTNIYTISYEGGPFRATLCWTDPYGTPIENNWQPNDGVLDNNTPMLVNDLDLRLIDAVDPEVVYYPYILDPNNPDAEATLGDNVLDNVEQIYLPSLPAGAYTVQVSHKGSLTNGMQNYSLILSEPRPVSSRQIFVDDNATYDPGPGNPNISDPDEDGSSERPFDCIQEAVDIAQTWDSVIVRDGNYTGTGNYNIDPDGKAITIRSENGSEECTIDCEFNGRGFVFVSGENAMTILDGFTIINGLAEDPYWPQEPNVDTSAYGGAIYCNGSSPQIKNCTITENEAESGGGAIFCYENSNPIISNCKIGWNYSGTGANIYGYNPDATYLSGGGLFFIGSHPTLINCTISYNSTYAKGGGVFCEYGYLTIRDCTIEKNISYSGLERIETEQGGGVYQKGGSLFVYESTINDNFSFHSGGGIAAVECYALIEDSSILDNDSGASAGGIYCRGIDNNTYCVINNCIISGNRGLRSGGISSIDDCFVQINNCTIADNISDYQDPNENANGIVCVSDGSADVENSIIWSSSPGPGFLIAVQTWSDSEIAVSYSDVKMLDANDTYNPNLVWEGTGNINKDPLFAKNRYDYHLKSQAGRWDPAEQVWEIDNVTSPCIDAGDPASEYWLEPAPNGSRINMGAYGNTLEASKSY